MMQISKKVCKMIHTHDNLSISKQFSFYTTTDYDNSDKLIGH